MSLRALIIAGRRVAWAFALAMASSIDQSIWVSFRWRLTKLKEGVAQADINSRCGLTRPPVIGLVPRGG